MNLIKKELKADKHVEHNVALPVENLIKKELKGE